MRRDERSSAALPTCRCQPLHHGQPVDAAALNRETEAWLASRADEWHHERGEVDCLIVPGYTPRIGWRKTTLHPLAAGSCAAAAHDVREGIAPLVIVSGGAVHGPANEAVLMREELLRLGVTAERILVEPCARHTTTNLRNAGRLMLAHGLHAAYVVCPDAPPNPLGAFRRVWRQSFYVGYPRLSSFGLRCRLVLGYRVGHLSWVRPGHTYFVPSPRCVERSAIPAAEGDP